VTSDLSRAPGRRANICFGLTMVVGLGGFTWTPNPTHFGGTNCGTRRRYLDEIVGRRWGIGSCPSGILLGGQVFR
jgi:hypothetical protein